MSAQLEEVVADADGAEAQLLFPKGGQLSLDFIARSDKFRIGRGAR